MHRKQLAGSWLLHGKPYGCVLCSASVGVTYFTPVDCSNVAQGWTGELMNGRVFSGDSPACLDS